MREELLGGPFVYRLGRKVFILERGVRFSYGLPHVAPAPYGVGAIAFLIAYTGKGLARIGRRAFPKAGEPEVQV